MEYSCLSKITQSIAEGKLSNSSPNLSLLMDKYYPCPSDDKKSGTASENFLESISELSSYTLNYVKKTKRSVLESVIIPLERSIGSGNFLYVVGKLKSNLAINLTTRFDNSGISLDRLTGVPTIWGSAVKGCCAHAKVAEMPTMLSDEVSLSDNLYIDTFGGSVEIGAESETKKREVKIFKGKVDFFPAFMLPEGACSNPIKTEIITPHKDDSPIPIYFPVVGAGAKFIFIVVLNNYGLYESRDGRLVETSAEYRAKILNYAKSALLAAFELGIGAKTSSNFGWFEVDEDETTDFVNFLEKTKQDIAEKAKDAEAKRELESMSPLEQYRRRLEAAPTNGQGKDGAFLSSEAKDLKNRTQDEQRIFIEVMKKSKKDALRSWRKKDKVEHKLIVEVAASLGITLE